MKKYIFSFLGLSVLLSAAVFFNGCSIKDPTSEFKVVISGEVETSMFETQEYTAEPESVVVFQDAHLSGTALTGNKSGNRNTAGTDAAISQAIEADLGTFNLTRFRAIWGASIASGQFLSGRLVNNTTNSVTITFCLSSESGLGTEILTQDGGDHIFAHVTIPEGQTLYINTGPGRLDYTTTHPYTSAELNAIIAGTYHGHLYVVGTGDPDLDVGITRLNVLYSAAIHVTKQVDPGDLADYDLEELRDVSVTGTINNNGSNIVNAEYYCSIGDYTGSDNDKYSAFSIPANGTFDFGQDTYYTDNGHSILMSRFQSLSNDNQTIQVDAFFTSSSTLRIQLNNINMVADAQIAQH